MVGLPPSCVGVLRRSRTHCGGAAVRPRPSGSASGWGGQAAGSRAVLLWVCLRPALCPIPFLTAPHPVPRGDPCPPAASPPCPCGSLLVEGSSVLCLSACLFGLVLVSVRGGLFHPRGPQAPGACLPTPPGAPLSPGRSQSGGSSPGLLWAGKPWCQPGAQRDGPELGSSCPQACGAALREPMGAGSPARPCSGQALRVDRPVQDAQLWSGSPGTLSRPGDTGHMGPFQFSLNTVSYALGSGNREAGPRRAGTFPR